MSLTEKVAKNATALMLATTGQKILAFVAFIIIARLTGKEQVGVFFYAVSITSIFVTFADIGMTPVVIRAVAGDHESAARTLGAVLRIKACLVPFSILGALLYAYLFGASTIVLVTVVIACGVMTADTIHLALYGALRGRQNLRPEAIGMFIGQAVTAVASVTAALLHTGPIGLGVALLLGSVWNVFWSVLHILRFHIVIHRPIRADYIKLAKQALPFGLAGMAVKVYSYIDSLFIKQFYGTGEVGLYAVAYKLTYALQFVPLTFTAALYPALASAYARQEHDDIRKTFVGSLRLMACIGFPLSAGLSALAPRIIPLLYSHEYLGSIPAFQILPWVLLPIFMDFPVGALLNATHRAHLKTAAMISTMVVNISMNAILVPHMGSVGAAWAGVISFWGLYLIGLCLTATSAGGARVLVSLSLRALIAAVFSWYAWHIALGYIPFVLAAVLGAIISILVAFAVKLVTYADISALQKRLRPPAPVTENIHE